MPSIGNSNYSNYNKPYSYNPGAGNSGGTGYNNNNVSPYGASNTGPSGYGNQYNSPYNAPQGDGWYNTQSGATNYQQQFAPGDAGWTGPAPGRLGQTFSYNPLTGEAAWVNSTEGLVIGSNNWGTGGKDTLTYVDPKTGMTTFNPSVLNSLMNSLGMSGSGSGNSGAVTADMPGFNPTTIDVPDEYGGYEFKQQAVDPTQAIESAMPLINKGMNDMFAAAGNKAGQSGWAMSTGYTGDLGESAKWANDQNANLIANLKYDAAKLASEQFHQQQLQAAQNDYNAWAQSGNWGMDSQMYTGDQSLQQWLANLNNNQFNAGQQNSYNIATQGNDQDMKQQLMMQILGGLF